MWGEGVLRSRRRSTRSAAALASALVLVGGVLWWGPVGGGAEEGSSDPSSDEPVVVIDDEVLTENAGAAPVGAGRELVGLRTAFSATFASDVPGLVTERVYGEPVHYQGGAGRWRAIDTSLLPRADGDGFRVAANSPVVEIAGDASAGELAAVELRGDRRVAMSLVGAQDAPAEVEGPLATFEAALPGVDVVLESVPAGLKETLVLAGPSSPREFRFDLSLEGLVAEIDEASGGVVLRDAPAASGAPGPVRLRIPAGFMFDSASTAPAFSDAVEYSLVEQGGATALRVTLDDGFLDDPARVWPVMVDPSVYSQTVLGDTYVVEGEHQTPAANLHAAKETLQVGEASDLSHRILLDFEVVTSLPATVHYAEVVLTPVGGCPSSLPLTLSAATESWDVDEVEWPGPAVTENPLLPDNSGYGMSCADGKARAQVTPIVQGWVEDGSTSHGLVVAAQDEDDPAQFREFASLEDPHTDPEAEPPVDNRPHLDITYSIEDPEGPSAPSSLEPSGELTTLNPTLVARYTHPAETDPPPGSLLFALRIAASDLVLGFAKFTDGSGNPVVLPSGTRGAIVVGGGLPADQTLEWRASAYNVDGEQSRWSPPSAWQTISTPATAAGCSGTADPGEQDDTFANATFWDTSTGPVEIDGYVCDDPDVYRISQGAQNTFFVDVEGDVDLDVAVYEWPSGELLDLYDSSGGGAVNILIPAGDWAIEIYGYRGASGPYTLSQGV